MDQAKKGDFRIANIATFFPKYYVADSVVRDRQINHKLFADKSKQTTQGMLLLSPWQPPPSPLGGPLWQWPILNTFFRRSQHIKDNQYCPNQSYIQEKKSRCFSAHL